MRYGRCPNILLNLFVYIWMPLDFMQWCELWDHLITNAADPSLLLFAVVSYVMFFRISLLTIVPTSMSTCVLWIWVSLITSVRRII